MKIDIISLFPEFFAAFFDHSIIKRAIAAQRLTMAVTNPRDFAHNKHNQVDDTPYGGGAGMLMMAPPIFEAVEHVLAHHDQGETHAVEPRKTGYFFKALQGLLLIRKRLEN